MDKQARAEKKRLKQEYWRSHITGWKKSSLSQIDYCKQNNLSKHRFTYWKCKEHKKSAPISFIPVIQSPIRSTSSKNIIAPLKILFGDRYRIEIGDGFSSDTLSRLMDTLERI